MNKKSLVVLKIFIISFTIVALIFSLTISQDSHHLEICDKHDCTECLLIHIAQNLIILVVNFFIAILVSFFIFYLLARIHKEERLYINKTLILQKVQLNE